MEWSGAFREFREFRDVIFSLACVFLIACLSHAQEIVSSNTKILFWKKCSTNDILQILRNLFRENSIGLFRTLPFARNHENVQNQAISNFVLRNDEICGQLYELDE